MKGQFNSPVNLPGDIRDPVPVAGPLVQVDPKADFATVVCVLVQGDKDAPPGTPGEPPVWVEGTGTWKKGQNNWSGTVSRDGRVIGENGVSRALVPGAARGIAIAVAVTEEEPAADGRIVPPRIDTITWCVNIELS